MLRLQQVTFMALHNFLGLSYELIASVRSTVLLYGKIFFVGNLSVLIGSFMVKTVSMEMVISCVFCVFETQQFENKRGPSAM